MAASYPSATKSFSTKSDGAGNTIHASHVNDLQDEVVAIENGLRSGLAHTLLPLTDATYHLGSASFQWDDAFLSGVATFSGSGPIVLSHASGASVAASAGPLALKSTTSVAVELDTNNNGTETFSVKDGAGTAMLTFTEAGLLHLNETANAKMTIGVTVNQGANDDEAVALKSSDAAHGITDLAETDTYGTLSKVAGANGGLLVRGLSDVTVGLSLVGAQNTAAQDKTTSATGAVHIVGQTKSGTGVTSVGSNGNMLVLFDNTTARFIWDAEGSAHADVEWVAFDTHDDVALLDALDRHLTAKDAVTNAFGEVLRYNRADLQAAQIVNFYDDGPRAMVNLTRLSMLLVGAVRQMGRAQADLRADLTAKGLLTA